MKLTTIVSGPLENNTYILEDDRTRQAVVIDPGQRNDKLMEYVRQADFTVTHILCTHGHYDHVVAVGPLKELTGAQVLIHRQDAAGLYDDKASLFALVGYSRAKPVQPDILVDGGEKLKVGDMEFLFIHTPGHSPGSMCILTDGMMFSGDTLFQDDVGRSDLPGGDEGTLRRSIRDTLGALAGDCAVYPGHGPSTTLSYEKRNNPYFK